MARVPEETIERIRNTADIYDVVAQYVDLKKRGRNFFGLCPFHSEKTPSFSVAPDKQIYHCFGCGAGGNVFSFIVEHENEKKSSSYILLSFFLFIFGTLLIFLQKIIKIKIQNNK